MALAATAMQRTLGPVTPEERAFVSHVEARRIALQSDMQLLRARYEEVMRWANPPWDNISRRVDPRPERATAERQGQNILHVDLVGPTLDRWAALQLGLPPVFRCHPRYVAPPLPAADPAEAERQRQQYDLDRAIAQEQATQIEEETSRWMYESNLHRTLLWAAWAKEAFGKAILRDSWDPDYDRPTVELLENPSQVYYGWTKRYGNRQLGWAMVVDQMSPEEANYRYGLSIPIRSGGQVDYASWTGTLENGEMDQRQEQTSELNRWVYAMEYWELKRTAGEPPSVSYALIVANRVVDGPTSYPWKRLPFHVLENAHIATWSHGKSTAEVIIPLNAAYDDMLARQAEVIEFESGPRYKGLNMANSGDEVDIPDPFQMVPLREGEDIQQIDTRVDFFPSQLQANELREAKYKATGLTPIAWGMSPNAQTSGRAMSAEWRAVELPLHSRLINLGPELVDIIRSWWDYAERYHPEKYRSIAQGYRRFEIIWTPLDIRDKTERTMDILQRLQANIIDPETAIEESGYENVPEILARIRSYLLDPVWNPLRYQQLLTLQQLEINIQMQRAQLEMAQQQVQQSGGTGDTTNPTGPVQADLAQQGVNAAVEGAQGPTGGSQAQNQGPLPGGGGAGMPLQTSILSQTPLQGGVGSRVIVPLSANASSGQTPR